MTQISLKNLDNSSFETFIDIDISLLFMDKIKSDLLQSELKGTKPLFNYNF